jgi:uncharacterized protein GlcG (DUF336 family)
MGNVVTKHSISSELAQKMVDQAVAKARQMGVAENIAILDDGGNLKAFSRMDGAPILSIEIAQNKAYTALFGVSTQDFFNFIQRDPSLLAGIPTLARVAAYGERVSHQGGRRGRRGNRGERGPHRAARRRLRESSPCARARCDAGRIIGAQIMMIHSRPEEQAL